MIILSVDGLSESEIFNSPVDAVFCSFNLKLLSITSFKGYFDLRVAMKGNVESRNAIKKERKTKLKLKLKS